ncbi:MAG: FHA domain-containing protein [bacterium]|nr:FHA domain-containing protein [bacterium]
MKLREFIAAHGERDHSEFVSSVQHGFLLINKTPRSGSATSFETRAPSEARDMLIRSHDQAELFELVAAKRTGRVTVGRTSINDIVLDGESISKFHAFFKIELGGSYSLCDPGSTNGTRVNGLPLEKDSPYPLKGGETITFGDSYEGTFHNPASLFRHLTMLKRWIQ